MADGAWARRLGAMRERARRARGERAEARQRTYQAEKALALARDGAIEEATADLVAYAGWVRDRIEAVRPIPPGARLLEVGSGAHGLVFFLGVAGAIGVDPLADLYRSLFPAWQSRATTVRAYGEALPFGDASFDVVISDNVIDHAERPAAVLREIARVLRPGGTLYFTVHVHHPVYAAVSAAHGAWNAAGLRYEIGPFADHTVHFTLRGIRSLLRRLPLQVLQEDPGVVAARAEAAASRPRSAAGWVKRAFFKNARFEIVAVRT